MKDEKGAAGHNEMAPRMMNQYQRMMGVK